MRYNASSFILLGIIAIFLLPAVVDSSLFTRINNHHHRWRRQHHLWTVRRGSGGLSSTSSSSRLAFIHRGGGSATVIQDNYNDISEDHDLFSMEADEGTAEGSSATSSVSPPEDDLFTKMAKENNKVEELIDDNGMKHDETMDTTTATETIHVVKKDGTLQPLEKEKVSKVVSLLIDGKHCTFNTHLQYHLV